MKRILSGTLQTFGNFTNCYICKIVQTTVRFEFGLWKVQKCASLEDLENVCKMSVQWQTKALISQPWYGREREFLKFG